MNTHRPFHRFVPGAATLAGLLLLSACATTPVTPDPAAGVRARLADLQSDPRLSGHARSSLEEAQAAVLLAETRGEATDEVIAHRVLLADRMIDIAIARAETSRLVAERGGISEARASTILDARTREADQARAQTERARGETELARGETESARRTAASDAESARQASASAVRTASADAAAKEAALQEQIALLQAEASDRGLVLTLGDLMFAFGKADLLVGAESNLDRLVDFLNEYPDRRVTVEGHTDSVGSEAFNQTLS